MRRGYHPATLVVLFIATLSSGCLGRLSGEHKICDGVTLKEKPVQGFSFLYDTRLKLIRLSGMFEIGILSTFNDALNEFPQATGVVFDSKGGNIYQARGIAQIIARNQLDTFVDGQCYSACTIAYIAGEKRYLYTDALLGFHTYDLQLPFAFGLNINQEQQKDLALYKAKIKDEAFTNKIFMTKCPALWIPTQQELLDAGVVHKIILTTD